MSLNWQYYANPTRFMALTDRLIPILGAAVALALGAGLWLALFASPPDYQQGETVRIMYVHVPSAWLSLMGFSIMAVASFIALIWRHPLADLCAKSAAPLGAAFTFLALVTGAFWGKPMWGAWWVWDARLTSTLILFFLYLGYMALWATIEEPNRAARIAAIFALVGSINLPIIRFSVDWWNTLHQPASVVRLDGPTMDSAILTPLLVMATAFTLFFTLLLLLRMRTEILKRRVRSLQLAQAGV